MSFIARGHPQQAAAPDSDINDRATTPEIFDPLNRRFGFTIDVAAAAHNAKCERFYDYDENGLEQSWAGERVYPPYTNIRPWVEKAWQEYHASLIVILVPANRTEQSWWQELVEPHRDKGMGLTTEFLPGRIRFLRKGQTSIGPNERPPFGCALLIWGESPLPSPWKLANLLQ